MVLLFGIVGMGFELFEGLFYIAEGGIAAVIIRSVLALHIMLYGLLLLRCFCL